MTQENLNAFIDRVKLDPAIQEELKLATDIEAIVKIAAAAGIELTAADLMSRPAVANNELDDAQLENISGGLFVPPGLLNGTFLGLTVENMGKAQLKGSIPAAVKVSYSNADRVD